MDTRKRKTIEGWIDKASNYRQMAETHAESYYRYSEAIQASQECVELSVKAILALLEVEYSRSHSWDREQLGKIAEQIQNKGILARLEVQNPHIANKLPRLLFLAKFWAQFYLEAKYGIEAGYLASAQNLFEKPDVDAAIAHAGECYNAASYFRYINGDQLNTIVFGD